MVKTWVLHARKRAFILFGSRESVNRGAGGRRRGGPRVRSERAIPEPDGFVDGVHVLLHAVRRIVGGGHVGPTDLRPRVVGDLLVLAAGGAADAVGADHLVALE